MQRDECGNPQKNRSLPARSVSWRRAGDSRVPQWERMSDISHGLKVIARQNAIPLVALVQLGRAATENGSGLENIRGSGSFEEDADLVLLLQRS